MKAYNKYFNYYQYRDGTPDSKLVINFDQYPAIKATIKSDDLKFYCSCFESITIDNKKTLTATKKAFKVINGLIQFDLDKSSQVDHQNDLVDSLDKRSLMIAVKFLYRFFHEYNCCLYALDTIEKRLTVYNY